MFFSIQNKISLSKNNPLSEWLTETGSLTAKLESFSGQKLIVQPTFEGRQLLSLTEKRLLNLHLVKPQSAWVRESFLYGNAEEPWVFARSIFPFNGLTGYAKKLTHLGKTPIGYIIFRRNRATLQQRWIEQLSNGWQRHSIYVWQGYTLLISEHFLPAFEQQLQFS